MAWDGNEEVLDILEDGDFDAVVLITVQAEQVQYFARLRDPVRTMLAPQIVEKVEKLLLPGIGPVNKYPI